MVLINHVTQKPNKLSHWKKKCDAQCSCLNYIIKLQAVRPVSECTEGTAVLEHISEEVKGVQHAVGYLSVKASCKWPASCLSGLCSLLLYCVPQVLESRSLRHLCCWFILNIQKQFPEHFMKISDHKIVI